MSMDEIWFLANEIRLATSDKTGKFKDYTPSMRCRHIEAKALEIAELARQGAGEVKR